ncbi:MAG: hypothetical protein NTNFB02_10420 [Nitrospira sp.]
MKYSITTRPTNKGLAFDLYVRWKGQRYRPLLGYNLTKEQADEAAIAMIARIQREATAPPATRSTAPTLKEFLPLYWQTMRVKKRVDLRRPASVIETHLVPRFGDRALDTLTAEDGLDYITARLEAKAAPWTIRREWTVLMRILNLAVDFEKLDKNRLRRVQLPDVANRERVASDEELTRIAQVLHSTRQEIRLREQMQQLLSDPTLSASRQRTITHYHRSAIELDRAARATMLRVLLVALHTGLREAKILEISRSWLLEREDGWWLVLPPARSRLKGTPKELPLNTAAAQALLDARRHKQADIAGRLFSRWESAATMGTYFRRLCQHAAITDLHFHDLRHVFTTRLQNLGVGLEVRAALLGHRLRSQQGDLLGGQVITSAYSHGGVGWNAELRRAVSLLEHAYPAELSDGMSYGTFREIVAQAVNAPNILNPSEKKWWSQRDSNPCLSLERAPS